MKVTGSSKRKDVSKDDSVSERKIESGNMVLGQIKLEDLEQERLEVRKSVEKKTTTKKPAEKKSVSTTKTAAAETKAEATAVAEAENASEEVKAEAKKETTAKKETKTTAKAEKETKTTTKTAKAAVSEKIVLQINGKEDLVMSSLIDRVKAAYAAEGNKADNIKNIEVYIKLEPENMAYYVIDGYASGISLY